MVPRPNKVFPAGTWWCQSWPGECGHPPQIHPPPQSQVLLSETIPEKNGKIYNYIRKFKEAMLPIKSWPTSGFQCTRSTWRPAIVAEHRTWIATCASSGFSKVKYLPGDPMIWRESHVENGKKGECMKILQADLDGWSTNNFHVAPKFQPSSRNWGML